MNLIGAGARRPSARLAVLGAIGAAGVAVVLAGAPGARRARSVAPEAAAAKAPVLDVGAPPAATALDLRAVMDQVHFAFRPEGRGFRGSLAGYQVAVVDGELAFTPPHATAVPDDAVRLGSARLARGGVPLSGEGTLTATNARAQLELVKGGVVERLANGPAGVEQTWSFETRPQGSGPLDVRIALLDGALVAETPAGLHVGSGAVAIRYGHGTWIDGRGVRTSVPARFEAGEIVLEVPGAVIDGSVYPAVLDPIISPEVSLNDPEGVTSADQGWPAVDWDGASYLVVWQDWIGTTTSRIVGARVNASGALQDPSGIVISSGDRSRSPAVSWNGSTHLVVWQQASPSGGGDRIVGARLGADGAVLDPITLCTNVLSPGTPAVSWNGTNHLVVWADRGTVGGARVTASGTVLDPGGFPISSGHAQWPAVAPSASNHLVVWMDGRNFDGGVQDVYGARVTSGGTVLDPSGIAISTGASWEEFPAVAWNGTENLVAWVDGRTPSWGLYGARVTTAGVVQDPSGFLISGGRGAAPANIAITSDGTTHLVAWTHGGGSDISAARVSRAGAVVDADGFLVAGTAQVELRPALVSGGPRSFLVAYERFGSGSDPYRVFARTLTFDGAPVARDGAISTTGGAVPVTLVANDPDDDPLTFTVVTAPSHGVLTGSAPSLAYTPAAGFHGSDALTFKANDGTSDSNLATISITVNHAPVAQGAAITVAEDVATAITLGAADADGDPLAFTTVSGPAHGTLTGTPPNLTYVPAAFYVGGDAFTFRVSDGMETSNVATVSITVYAANHAPVAQDLALTGREDEPVSVVLRASDLDFDRVTYAIVSVPAHGTLYSTPPELAYVPDADFFGVDGFTYKVNDGSSDSAIATVTITVTPVADAPVANPAYVGAFEDASTPITLTATDADGDPLTFTTVTQPSHGVLVGTPPHLAYLPSADYHGSDAFSFKASDSTLESAAATISITVFPVEDAPVARGATLTVAEDGSLPIILVATDVDGDALTFTTLTAPAHGTLVGAPPALTYVPAPDYSGVDAFTFKASDGTLDSAVATVSITVTPVNDDPVAIAGSVTVATGTASTIPLSAADADGDPLSYAIVAGPQHGALSGAMPAVTYTPDPGYLGTDAFTFSVSDGHGGTSGAAVSITVTAAPQPAPPPPPGSPGGCGCTSGTGAEPLLGALALVALRRRRGARTG